MFKVYAFKASMISLFLFAVAFLQPQLSALWNSHIAVTSNQMIPPVRMPLLHPVAPASLERVRTLVQTPGAALPLESRLTDDANSDIFVSNSIPATSSEGAPHSNALAWLSLVTPVAYMGLSFVALWRMFSTKHLAPATVMTLPSGLDWAPLSPLGLGASEEAPMAIQMRAGTGYQGGNYGRRKPGPFAVALQKAKAVGKWFVNTAKAFGRWVRNSPIDVVMLLIFLCSWALWLNPGLEYLFLTQGFRNPLAFLGSGFSCFNIYQLYSDIFYVYILGKAYCVEFSPKELAVLYGGGTIVGSLLVALTPGGWMGPTAGTAALLTAFMLRYPGTPMAIPMIPLIFFPFQVRWIGTILALTNFYLFTKGVASGAAFTGGVLFALLLKPRRELSVQDISLS